MGPKPLLALTFLSVQSWGPRDWIGPLCASVKGPWALGGATRSPGHTVILLMVLSAVAGANSRTEEAVTEVIARHGDEVVLWCIFALTPPTEDRSQLHTHWLTVDGKEPYEGASRLVMHLTGKRKSVWNATLVLERVTPANAGLYRCMVSYQNNQQETCQILLKVKDAAPSILKPPPAVRFHHLLLPAVKPGEQIQRYLKVGMVLRVLATACGVAIILMVCFKG